MSKQKRLSLDWIAVLTALVIAALAKSAAAATPGRAAS